MRELSIPDIQNVFKAIDPWISQQVTEGYLPMLGLAAYKDGQLVCNRIYEGSGKVSSPNPGCASLFAMASQSKTVTIAAIFKLAEQDKLRLDDFVVDIIPELDVHPQSPFRQIRIKDLMRHQSPLGFIEKGIKFPYGMDAKRLLRQLSQTRLNSIIAERVSQKPLETYIVTNLFRPNSIRDIFPSIKAMSSFDRARIVEGHDIIKEKPFTVKPMDRQALNAPLGMVASVEAMAHFYDLLLTGKILSPHHTEMILRDTVPFGPRGSNFRTSFGVHHMPVDRIDSAEYDPEKPDRFISHAGKLVGFSSLNGRYEPLGLTISCVTNSLNLPACGAQNSPGQVDIINFGRSMFCMLRQIAGELRQNKNFEEILSLTKPLHPLRIIPSMQNMAQAVL
jgi:CubicO group peptidase (beta-lactamase class C family)